MVTAWETRAAIEAWRATQQWVTAATSAEQQAWAVGGEAERRPASRGDTRGCCVCMCVCLCTCGWGRRRAKLHDTSPRHDTLYFIIQRSSMLLGFSLQSAESGGSPLQVHEEKANIISVTDIIHGLFLTDLQLQQVIWKLQDIHLPACRKRGRGCMHAVHTVYRVYYAGSICIIITISGYPDVINVIFLRKQRAI